MAKSNFNVFIRSEFNYDMNEASDASGLHCKDESLTVQSEKDDADLNVIMARYGVTGRMPDVVKVPQYGDFTGVSDFQSALNVVRAAQEGFMELPADVRYRFANDPQRLLEFVNDSQNRDEAVRLGLVPAPAPKPAEVVTPQAAAPRDPLPVNPA